MTSAKLRSRVDLRLFLVNWLICVCVACRVLTVCGGNLKDRLSGERIVEGVIGGQDNVFRGGQSIGVGCLFFKLLREHQIVGPPEVGDELGETAACSGVRQKAGGGQ